MKSPIKFRRHLVTKAPYEQVAIEKSAIFRVRLMEISDINSDEWLIQRQKAFQKMLSEGHIGFIALNEDNECVAYSFIATGKVKPSHLPKIPEGSAWNHYSRVRDDYQGKGIHRLLMKERNMYIKEQLGINDIYADTSIDNISSRINQLRLGYKEYGIYYTVKIGTRRIPFIHFLFGIWLKNKKHPEIQLEKQCT